MIYGRRQVLQFGGGLLAALALPIGSGATAEGAHIQMAGTPSGSRVWFSPVGILIQPGQSVRWTNIDTANVHTATAYHPDNFGRERRMPPAADAWDSGYLMPGDEFSVTFNVPGVYDYYCVPHEMAGMAGRIVVGTPPQGGWDPAQQGDLPDAAFGTLPALEEILERGVVAPPCAS